jgi:predicted HTH domain antitoxin
MKLILDLPEYPEFKNLDVKGYLFSKLYEDGILSLGQSAEALGTSKEQLLENLGNFGVSVFSTSVEDFLKDIKNA